MTIDYLRSFNIRRKLSDFVASYIKYAGVLLIEGNTHASEMASTHSQDEVRARDFEGDNNIMFL